MEFKRGLSQVTIESGDQFFRSLELTKPEAGCSANIGTVLLTPVEGIAGPRTLGIPWLDTLVLTPRPPLSRHQAPSTNSSVSHSRSMVVGDVLELVGPSTCGKTLLLYEMLLHTILPYQWTPRTQEESLTVPIGGLGSQVYFFDCDMRIDMRKILEFGIERVSCCIASQKRPDRLSQKRGISSEAILNLVKACLIRVHIFRPTSSRQLLLILAGLSSNQIPNSNHHPKVSSTHPLNLVVIDSLTQFYWASKKAVSVLAKNQQLLHQKDLMDVLKLSLKDTGAFAVVTSWPPFPQRAQNQKLEKKPDNFFALPPPPEPVQFNDGLNSSDWTNRVTYRVRISPYLSDKGKLEVETKLVHPPPLSGQLPLTRRAAIGPQKPFVQKSPHVP